MTAGVLFLSAGKIGADGSSWYRMEQPAAAFRAVGVAAEVRNGFRGDFGDDRRLRAILNPERTIVFQRPLADTTREAVEVAGAEGRRVLVELDDDLWVPSPDRQRRALFTREMVANLTACCHLADAVIVSTPGLAARVRRATGQREIAVIPNAIDPGAMPPLPALPPGPLVVGWAGSASHRDDMRVALPALRAAGQLPDVLLSMQGEDLLAGTGIPHRHAPWTSDVRKHYLRVALLRVAVAPLVPSAFNAAKSSVKWLESSWFGAPMVLSKVGPYAADVRDGETGLLADGPAAFKRHLLRLIDDPVLRAEIGLSARGDILERHLIAHRVPYYREVLDV